jgi:hypothetical protein
MLVVVVDNGAELVVERELANAGEELLGVAEEEVLDVVKEEVHAEEDCAGTTLSISLD